MTKLKPQGYKQRWPAEQRSDVHLVFASLWFWGCAEPTTFSPDVFAPALDAGIIDGEIEDIYSRDSEIIDAGYHDSLTLDASPSDGSDVASPFVWPENLEHPFSASGHQPPDRRALLAGCVVAIPEAPRGTDLTQLIQVALNQAAPGCAIVLPTGEYLLTDTLTIPSRIVMMGQGADQTALYGRYGARAVPMIRLGRVGSPLLTASGSDFGGARGSRVLTVSATVARIAGDLLPTQGWLLAHLQEANDPQKLPARWYQSYADRAVGQMFRVVGLVQGQLLVDPPLTLDFLPGGREYYLTLHAPDNLAVAPGLMDLTLERLDDAHESTVVGDRVVDFYLTRVILRNTGWAHVALDRSLGCLITQSHFTGAHGHGDGGRGYGVNLRYQTTGCRIEDNIFTDLRHAMIVQLGATGNVFGYNYSEDSHDDRGWLKADISVHGHYAHHNLFEGNDIEKLHISDWHGPTPYQVAYRNRARRGGLTVDDASENCFLLDNFGFANFPLEVALRVDRSVVRVYCGGNQDPSGTPLAAEHPGCDSENLPSQDSWGHRPASLYRAGPLLGPEGGLPAEARWRAGMPVPGP